MVHNYKIMVYNYIMVLKTKGAVKCLSQIRNAGTAGC